MSEDWKAAIEHLYAVFACYRRPTRLDASPARDPEAIMRDLSSAPLRELPAQKVGPYAGHAMTTVGSEDEYRHFLPRIIELSASVQSWMGLEPEQIASKLNYGHWPSWAEDARAAVLRAFTEAWYKARKETPDMGDASSQLCALAILGVDIAPLLSSWTFPGSADEVRQMAAHIQAAVELAGPAYWRNAGEANRRALWRWARSEALRGTIEAQAQLVAYENLWEVDRAFVEIEALPELYPEL